MSSKTNADSYGIVLEHNVIPYVLFRGAKYLPLTDGTYATNPDKDYSITDHSFKKPKDSNWISMTKTASIALWFALHNASIGDKVYIFSSYLNGSDVKVYKVTDNIGSDDYAIKIAKWEDECVVSKFVQMDKLYEIIVSHKDVVWFKSVECLQYSTLYWPEHRSLRTDEMAMSKADITLRQAITGINTAMIGLINTKSIMFQTIVSIARAMILLIKAIIMIISTGIASK